MKDLDRKIEARLERCLDALASPSPEPGIIEVSNELRRLSEVDRGFVSEGVAESLQALCRKIQVRKSLSCRYLAAWRPIKGSAPLPANGWEAVILVLLRHAIPGRIPGLGLKLVNAAFVALDEAPEGVGGRDELEALASQRLQELTS